MASSIWVTHFTDPGCPWAYSAEPAIHVLRWRYGDQLAWRTVVIGLAETREHYAERGYTPSLIAHGYRMFRERFGMPFSVDPKPAVAATGPACRAVVAVRLDHPELEAAALRALRFAWFTTPWAMDEDVSIARALEDVPGLDPAAVLARRGDRDVEEAYQRDRDEDRTAAGSASQLQGKTERTDGPERYTAPSLIFERDGKRLEAGGWQPVEAYDVLLANLDPGLERRPPPDGPLPLLEEIPGGLTTHEVAALLAPQNVDPDRDAAESALIQLAVEGRVRRRPLADDALWTAATG